MWAGLRDWLLTQRRQKPQGVALRTRSHSAPSFCLSVCLLLSHLWLWGKPCCEDTSSGPVETPRCQVAEASSKWPPTLNRHPRPPAPYSQQRGGAAGPALHQPGACRATGVGWQTRWKSTAGPIRGFSFERITSLEQGALRKLSVS